MSADKKTTLDTDWQQTYASTITSAEKAVKQIRPGQRVFVGTGCGQPQELVKALAARANELSDTEIVHL
ncbi:MAG: CoA-transferase, partial [Pseudomonadota bacterium]